MHQTESQAETFALLSDPATHGGAPVRRIDTHAASVFLAGERAYKVKRAIQFPFLDYSTLPKRKAACEAELTVNRPFAPDIYLRVVAVMREHARAPVVEAEPWIEAVRRFIAQNDAEFREAPDSFSPTDAEALSRASRVALDRVRPLLRARGAQGLVRRGHGDLHLGNIALIDG